MNAISDYLHVGGARRFGLVSLLTLLLLVFAAAGQAAGMQHGGGQGTGDQVQDQLRLRDGSCTDTLIMEILEGDQDQLRLRDGSCGNDCDGDPDQDQVRDRLGQP